MLTGMYMLDEIQAVSLLLLIIGHGFLIRGCFNIHTELPVQGRRISDALGNTTNMIDELADLLNELLEGVGQPKPSSPAGPVDIPTLLSMFLNNNKTIPPEHGPPQQEEWEVLPPNENPPNEVTNQSE